jgi:hypothetical protein
MARDWHSVPISTIADGYHGYGKKEIKSQIAYVASMFGMCNEGHSRGTLFFERYDLIDRSNYGKKFGYSHGFENIINSCSKPLNLQDSFAIDKHSQL